MFIPFPFMFSFFLLLRIVDNGMISARSIHEWKFGRLPFSLEVLQCTEKRNISTVAISPLTTGLQIVIASSKKDFHGLACVSERKNLSFYFLQEPVTFLSKKCRKFRKQAPPCNPSEYKRPKLETQMNPPINSLFKYQPRGPILGK